MIKKALVVAVMLLAAMSARAQIGYKGQVALGVSGGISNVGGFVSTVRIDSYLSERSILGAGIILDRTRYDATQGDSFHTSQWLGVLHYRYAIPLGRFIVSPTGGVLLGGEQCDQRSRLTVTSLFTASCCSVTSSMSSAGIGLLLWSPV